MPGATHLVADEAIAGRDAERGDSILQFVSFGKIEAEIGIREARSGVAGAIVAPLAESQSLYVVSHGMMRRARVRQAFSTFAAVWPNNSFLPSSVTAG